MGIFVVDVEADGPCPPLYSMVSFGAVLLTEDLTTTFYGEVMPISPHYKQEALAISGVSRDQHLTFDSPESTIADFAEWIESVNQRGRPVFMSDNPAFDWQWSNYYFHAFYDKNPFGHSARRIGDLFSGMERDFFYGWKKHRKTKHDHNPVNDAKGNAEALLYLKKKGLNIPVIRR